MSELQREWLNDPEFSCWLSGVPGDDFAYCKLCNKEITLYGKSSLRSHAKGIKHSELEEECRKKRRTASSSSRPSAPVRPLNSGSSNAKVNINLINVPGTSTAPDMHLNVSTHKQKQLSHKQKQLYSEMHSSTRKTVRERSPSESSHSDSSTSCDSSSTSNSE